MPLLTVVRHTGAVITALESDLRHTGACLTLGHRGCP